LQEAINAIKCAATFLTGNKNNDEVSIQKTAERIGCDCLLSGKTRLVDIQENAEYVVQSKDEF
jgi:hypothetical protein